MEFFYAAVAVDGVPGTALCSPFFFLQSRGGDDDDVQSGEFLGKNSARVFVALLDGPFFTTEIEVMFGAGDHLFSGRCFFLTSSMSILAGCFFVLVSDKNASFVN